MNEYIVETHGLTKKFKSKIVVRNVDLHIKKGEIYGFLGPNGAGKTTTIRMLLGLSKPTKGSIHLFGKDMTKERLLVLKRVGSLVESPSYYGHLTAYENLETLRILLDAPKSRIDKVLSIVRLSDEATRPVKDFSLGMKQRLGIAAALLNNPELLILDEPTNGLDPSGILEIRELMKSLSKEHGITILVSSHLLSEVDQIATQVGILSKGEMIFQGSMEKLKQRSKSKIAIQVHDVNAAWNCLLSYGYLMTKQSDRLLFENLSDQTVAQMIQTLVQNNISIYRVQEERKSLEDIFLELTSRKEVL
ncbi:ABC transporter ATP-binding protein [Bacillus smithii]|uniref:ABC transporter ATP-binding protein n=1 Tax=Bacillus smithii TaxID=1479 RepID=UPI002E237BFB|nr:ABC transporter ATP-binding protein [Bacillus smithii]